MALSCGRGRVVCTCVVVWIVACCGGPVAGQGTAKPWCQPVDVPKEDAELGQVYYVLPTKQPQVTFHVRAEYAEFKGVTHAIDGYFVVPKDESMPAATGLAGQFCLPVASLRTGDETRDLFLETNFWLDSDKFPEILFRLTKVRRANEIRKNRASTLYGAFLEGEMTIAGHTKPMTIPARITLMPSRSEADKTARGDRMRIHAKFGLDLRDFGIEGQEAFLKTGRMTFTFRVEVDLALSTVRPKRPDRRPIPLPKPEKTPP